MLEKRWKTLGGEAVEDIAGLLRSELALGGKEVHVGTDSQQAKKVTEYVTVLVLVTPSKGGRVLYCRERVPRIRSLRERLHKEAWLSTELAMELTQTPDVGGGEAIIGDKNDLTIHIDANPSPRHKSSEHVQELAGLCVGQGFRCLLKPDSWASTHVADHAVKRNVLGKR